MRKISKIFGIASFVLLLLQACASEALPMEEENALKDGQIEFVLPPFNAEGDNSDTKTYYDGSKLVWSATDTIGIIPASGSPIYFTNLDEDDKVTFDGGGWKLKASTQYTSFYPFVYDMLLDVTALRYSVEGQSQQAPNQRVHDGYDCLWSKATTTDGSAVTFAFSRLCICLDFQVTPPAGVYTRLDICADEDIIPLEAACNLTLENPSLGASLYGRTLSLALNNFEVDGSTQIHAYLMAIPCDWQGKAITVKLVSSEGREYDYAKTPSRAYDAPNTLYTLQLDNPEEVPNAAFLSQTKYGLYDLSGSAPSAIFQYAAGDQISRYIRPEFCEFRIGNPFTGKFMAFSVVPGSDASHKTLETYAPFDPSSNTGYTSYSGQTYEDAQVLYSDGEKYYLKKDNLGFIVKYTEL